MLMMVITTTTITKVLNKIIIFVWFSEVRTRAKHYMTNSNLIYFMPDFTKKIKLNLFESGLGRLYEFRFAQHKT